MFLTIFTPLYNREKSIRNVYNSLICQTHLDDFEWLVINDGSTDNSSEIITEIINNHTHKFPIRYYTQTNKGLARTINRAISIANGTLFCRLDSDDYATPTMVEYIFNHYPLIKDSPKLCSIVFLSQTEDEKINGYHPFPTTFQSNFSLYRDKYHATGDRSEVMKTQIYRQYKFPEIENEKFCPEGLVWNRIAKDYDALYINLPIYVKSPASDSITSQIYQHLKRNCIATTQYYYEIITDSRFSFIYRVINAIKYYRYAFFANANIIKNIPWIFVLLGLPCGILVIIYDKLKHK